VRRRAAATLGVAAALGTAAAVVAVRRMEQRWRAEADPAGDDLLTLPQGRSFAVTTGDGAVLAVTDAGEGPLVVLAHCYAGSRAVWAPVARRLVARGRRVVLWDQRGHGESTVGADGLTVARLGEDLRDVLDAVDAHGAVLVGHSMGGMAVMALIGDHPAVVADRASAVVLVSTAAVVPMRVVGPGLVATVASSRLATAAVGGPFGHLLVRPSVGRRPVWSHLDATARLYAATAPETRAELLRSIAAMDLRPGLALCPVPAVIVAGSRDGLTLAGASVDIAGHLPRADVVILPDSGHMLPFEEPDRLADLVIGAPERRGSGPPAGARRGTGEDAVAVE
jgi:pimeloyl-ACP methyl ester carboxylesterase